MTDKISKHDLVAFLQEHLRPDDFNRICYLSRNKTNCRLLLRMTQKINDVEHILNLILMLTLLLFAALSFTLLSLKSMQLRKRLKQK